MNETSQNYIRIYLIISSCLLGLFCIPAIGLAMFAPMMFDAPGSTDSTLTVSLASSIILFPLLIVLSIAISWFLFVKNKLRWSAIIMSIPYFNGLLVIVFFILLEVMCDGNFGC